ncbi:MAG: hypothetical protein COC23_01785 [Hyphomicrobiales bacterium]|nr:MAG: hypothetical protein COC23_01785 [Hyphomicrobiales bacterium]
MVIAGFLFEHVCRSVLEKILTIGQKLPLKRAYLAMIKRSNGENSNIQKQTIYCVASLSLAGGGLLTYCVFKILTKTNNPLVRHAFW